MSLSLLRKLLMKEAVKDTASSSGIMSINKSISDKVEKQLQKYVSDAMQQGVDLDALSPEQLKMIVQINKPKPPRVIPADSPEGRGITQALFGKRGEIIDFPQKRSFKQEVDDMIKDGTIKMGKVDKISDKVRTRNMFKDSNLNKTEAQIKAEIEASNKKAVKNMGNKRELTEDEYQDFLDEVGGADQLEAYNFDGTVGDAKRIVKEQKDYMSQMEMEFRKGKLDPEPGSRTPQRKRFLQSKLDEAEASGDARLLSREEREELFDLDDIEDFADGGVAGLLGERTGFRGGGAYQGGTSSRSRSRSGPSRGPAGGASAGGNYGGNVNPNQTYAGRTLSQRPSNYGGTGPSTTSGGGGGPPGTNTGGGGGGTTTTPTNTPPSFRELIRQKQILDYLNNLEEEDLTLSVGPFLGGILKKGAMKKGPIKIDEEGIGLEFLKKYNYLGDSNLKFNLDTKYKDLLKGDPKLKAGFERNIRDFKLKGDIDTDKNIGLKLTMPTNFFNRNKRKSRTNFDNRFAPDISKFNFEDLTGIKSTIPANRQMAKVYNTQDIEKLLGIKDQKTAEKFVEDPFTSSPRFITREKRTEPRTQAEAMDLFRENLLEQETKFPSKPFEAQRQGSFLGISPTDRNLVPSDFLDKPGEAAIQTPFGNIAAEIEEKYPMADGGPARQNFRMGKRAFLKLMGGIGAGIAGLKSGLIGMGGKGATKQVAKEVVKQSASTPPPYFFNLVKKIKNLGDDVTKRSATKDREVVTEYKDYRLTEDVATGETTIQRVKIGDDGPQYYDEVLAEETYMNYKPGKGQADETTGKVADEYTEDTSYLRTTGPNKGDIYDTVDGVADDVVEEGTVFEDNMTEFGKIKKASGGIARMLGE